MSKPTVRRKPAAGPVRAAASNTDDVRACLLNDVGGLVRGLPPDAVAGWIELAAANKVTTLIHGPVGCGKTRLAKHFMAVGAFRHSVRWDKCQILNLATIRPEIAEFRLFGSVGNQFTSDKSKASVGIIEAADQGAVFLDEIHHASDSVQAQLLRTIEEGKVRKMGGLTETKVDVWFIAASSRPDRILDELLCRLAGISIELTPLVERREMIVELAEERLRYWLVRFGKEDARTFKPGNVRWTRELFEPEVRELLRNESWPGNVRQLDQTMMRIALGVRCLPREVSVEEFDRARAFELDDGLVGKTPGGGGLAASMAVPTAASGWQDVADFDRWMSEMVERSRPSALPNLDHVRRILAREYHAKFGTYAAAAKALGIKTPSTVSGLVKSRISSKDTADSDDRGR